jgi:hypothetical protein
MYLLQCITHFTQVYFTIGRSTPQHCEDMAKYSGSRTNILIKLFNPVDNIDQNVACSKVLNVTASQLIAAALAKSTWQKHISGWNALYKFECENSCAVKWPVKIETIRSFALWCVKYKNLKVGTVKAYISSIVLAHDLQGLHCDDFNKDRILNLMLNGAENLQMSEISNCNNRRVATLDTLLIIGHRIAVSNWTESSKIALWSLCTTAFFTSARLGELLCKSENFFDKNSDLLWKDVKFNTSHILIHVKNPKVKSKNSSFLDIFKFKNDKCCPVLALTALKSFQEKENLFDANLPVFRFGNGKNVTQSVVNKTLRLLLSDLYQHGENSLTGHSFRGGIPSKLVEKNVMQGSLAAADWGRWGSKSYENYCRLKTGHKSSLYDIISSVLN